jgi:hypothetical protein
VALAYLLLASIRGSTLDVLSTGCHFLPEDAPARVGDTLKALLAR